MELEGFLELHCGAKGGESQGGGGVDEKSGGIDSIPNNTINIPTIGHEATLLVVSLSMVPRPADPIGACVDDL